MAAPTAAAARPSRAKILLGAASVLVDAVVVAAFAERALRCSSESGSGFGWTADSPLAISLVRFAYLLILLLAGSVGRLREGCWRQLSNILEVLFPYVFFILYGSVFAVRLVCTLPSHVQANDFCFWTLSIAGIVCCILETYTTLEVQHWTSRRRRETGGPHHQRDRLAAGLLADDPSMDESERPSGAGHKQNNEQTSGERFSGLGDLVALVLPEWPLLIRAFILLILAAIAEACIPKFVGEAITTIIRAQERGTLEERPFADPVVKLLIAAFACGLCSSTRGATFVVLGSKVSMKLRLGLFDNLLRQEIGFFDKTKTGEIVSRLTQDCSKVSDQVQFNVNVFLRTVVQTITTLVFMTSVSPQLTYVAFVSVPIVGYLSKKYGSVISDMSRETQKILAEANAGAQEALSSMPTLRGFAGESIQSQLFADKLATFGRLKYSQARAYVGYMASVIFLPQTVTALVLFYGGKLTMDGSMKAEGLVSFVFYLQILNNSFGTLGDSYTNMMTALGAASRAFELRERVPELPLEPKTSPPASIEHVEGALKLEGLRFSYPTRPDVEVLKGFSLDVPAGQVVSLVGPSGNGKSTIIGLLKRLYKAEEGRILLDGTDIWDFGHHDFHRTISIVGQEPVLYARTIRENIVFGLEPFSESAGESNLFPSPSPHSRASFKEVVAAAEKANAHSFIQSLPDGYETQVGERGVQLSGGQKQRIAIARALVRKPKVLLLDEATSALDSESERAVQQAIDAMIADGSMTVIIVAHRLSTVRNSHKICVVQSGTIVEEGTHDDLVSKQGAYFRLVQSQLSHASPQVAAS